MPDPLPNSLDPNSLPVPVAVFDRDERVLSANEAFRRLLVFGGPIVGRSLVSLLGDEAVAPLRAQWKAVLAKGSFKTGVFALPLGASVHRLQAALTPLTLANGQEAVVLTLLEVCVQSEYGSMLAQADQRFRELADSSPVALWITEPDGRCTYLNRRWYEFTGQTPAEAEGLGWLNAVHSEDRPEAGRIFLEANASHLPYAVDYRLRRHDGNYFWFLDAASPRFSPSGEFLGYVGSVVDIHARREAEDAVRRSRERFDIVRDASEVGFWFCDLPFTVLEWDNRVKEHFWLPPSATVPIELFYERIHPEDRERTRLAIEDSIRNHTRYDIEYRTVDPVSGQIKWIRAMGRTFYGAEGQPIRFDGVTLDTTGKKHDENALRAAKEAAERASKAKDDFLAQLSHELRTPLTPVLMIAESLREDSAVPAFARAQLATIARNVALEARLIDDLLDLTRITHGKLILRAEECDVHELLNLVTDIIADEAREKSITLDVKYMAGRSMLKGDPARLQQVFWNLLRNAVKFTPAGGHICIRTVDTDGSDGSPNMLAIEVSDNGMGFEATAAERLFAPFERGAATNDQRFPGLGLGLAIARAIVDLHGGRIEARSDGPGRGALFTVHLPGATGREVKANVVLPAAATQPEEDISLRLLFVEDHAPTREVLARYLRRHGHEVVVANSLASALDAAAAGRFDLVLSDLGLPDGTGIQLMGMLRELYGLSGIALSGYGMEEDMRRSVEAGFVAHLVKPVDVKEVRRALRAFARR